MMLDTGELYSKLVDCEPSLRGSREKVGESFYPDPPGIVATYSELGERIAENFVELRHPQALFGLIEEGARSPDETLRTAVCTGLIEAIITYCDYHPSRWNIIVPYLGTASAAYARSWITFTQGGHG